MTCKHCNLYSLKEMVELGKLETDYPEDYKNINVCARHGGGLMLQAAEKKRFHEYIIAKSTNPVTGEKVQETFNRFAESTNVMSLRGEIAILRHMIENIYHDCADDPDKMMLYSGRLTDLIVKAEKLVTSCNRIEMKADMFLNETLALAFAASIIEIIKKYVTDPEKIRQISSEIPEALDYVVNS